jgi:hypothetical protein
MTTQLSTELITHRVKIKGEGTRYITRKTAEDIYSQLTDLNTKTVNIANDDTLAYFSKYKTDIELYPLDQEERTLEDSLHFSGLKQAQKEQIRLAISNRKKEGRTTSQEQLQAMIEKMRSE